MIAKAVKREYTSHLQQLGMESTKGCVAAYLLADVLSENVVFSWYLCLYLQYATSEILPTQVSSRIQT